MLREAAGRQLEAVSAAAEALQAEVAERARQAHAWHTRCVELEAAAGAELAPPP